MPDSERIDPVLVEKAVKAFNARERGEPTRSGLQQAQMEAAIGVVFDELGLKEEETMAATRRSGGREVRHRRYRSDWRPVEQGDAQ